MAFVISSDLLTRTVTIKRPSSTPDARGLMGAASTISATAKVRIYSNNDFIGTGDVQEQGIVAASSHRGMMLPTEDVETGDQLIDNSTSETFNVNLADTQPAGVSGHHIQLFLLSSEYG